MELAQRYEMEGEGENESGVWRGEDSSTIMMMCGTKDEGGSLFQVGPKGEIS